jgi:hypothetical protein
MSKKCPPGVFCIENMTFIILIFLLLAICYTMFFNQKHNPQPIVIKNSPPNVNIRDYHNLADPYNPPLKPILNIPINQRTQGGESSYGQVGILTRINGPETILPLMGKSLLSSRDKWQFYTMSDKNNSVRLPITHNGKSCTNEYGCDNLYNGDSVYVEGYNDAFQVTMYENNSLRYIPSL